MAPLGSVGEAAGACLVRLRAARPLVHCLTNMVTMHAVAQAIRAAGAVPVMASAPEEVDEIAASADVVVINLGTPSRERLVAAHRAASAAVARGRPVVLDPVAAGASAFRTAAARGFLAGPGVAIVRANAGEAAALHGAAGTVRGVEALDVGEPAEAARALARRYGAVAAITGATDHVHDGRRHIVVDHQTAALDGVIGAGDVATALVGACAAVEADYLLAAAAGLVLVDVAASLAAATAAGPGSLLPALLDALATLPSERLAAHRGARVVEDPWT